MDSGPAAMSAVSRFLREGLLDAERRVATLTSPQPVDDARVMAQVESSAAFAVVSRVVNYVARGYESSSFVARADRMIGEWWLARSWRWRRFAGGVILVVAAVTYLGLYLLQQSPVGWLWFLVPALALVIGALSIVAAGTVERRTSA
jgi:hypothetical protein